MERITKAEARKRATGRLVEARRSEPPPLGKEFGESPPDYLRRADEPLHKTPFTPDDLVRVEEVRPFHKTPSITPDDIVEARKVKYIGGRPREIGWSRPFPLPPPPSDAIPPERRDEFNRLMSAVHDSPLIHGSDAKKLNELTKEFGLEQYFSDLAEAETLARLLASGRPVKVYGSDVKRFQELMERLGVELPQPLHKQALILEHVDQPIAPRTPTSKTRRAKRSTRKSKRLSRLDYATTMKGFRP